MRLTEKAIIAIRRNNLAIGRLIMEFNRGQNTIENWLKADNSPLTTPKGVQLITEETGLSKEEILEDTEKEVA